MNKYNKVMNECNKAIDEYLETMKRCIPASRGYTLDELSKIEGAFDDGRLYRCVSPYFTHGEEYKAIGHGIQNNNAHGNYAHTGGNGLYFIPINFSIEDKG